MKKEKLIIFIMLFLFLFVKNINAKEAFIIDNYNVDIKVNLDNSYDIEENISLTFSEYRHGIIRYIPYNNTVIREDNSKTKTMASIKKISIDNKSSITTSKYYKEIKIGDPNKTIIGREDYKINYKFIIGSDNEPAFDEFYFNIIGTEWDTEILSTTFSITMPKDFDKENIKFSYGTFGEGKIENLEYKVEGNKIIGELNSTLYEKEGLTIRLLLPEGYYTNIKSDFTPLVFMSFLLPILFLLYALFAWFNYAKDEKPVEVVEFYPPDNLNSLDIAFMNKGNATKKDVVSLLIYLANKGYIKIKEIKKGVIIKKDSFELHKVKDYDGDNKEEKLFMNGLFKNKNIVREVDLQEKFYTTIDSIILTKNSLKNKSIIYDQKYNTSKMLIIIFMILTFILKYINPIIRFGFTSLYDGVRYVDIYQKISFVLGLELLILAIFLFIKPKRTMYGNEILGRIKGFTHFLKTAEKDKLELMVQDDPNYFYNILPFTYVLGVSTIWIKKFESIIKTPPEWYDGNRAFDMYVFSSFMNNTYKSAESSMTRRPPAESGGSFSGGGGGFSGGGSGGGGGSSW